MLTPSQQQQTLEVVSSAVTELLALFAMPLPSNLDARQQSREMAKLRNAYKALTYVFAIIVQVAEKSFQLPDAAGGKAAKKATKVRFVGCFLLCSASRSICASLLGITMAANVCVNVEYTGCARSMECVCGGVLLQGAKADSEGEASASGGDEGEGGDDGFQWAKLREPSVDLLVRVVAVDFRRMWPMGLPEEVGAGLVHLQTCTR